MSVNVYLVRTRLQALIVNELISRKFSSSKSILVFLFQSSRSEDSFQALRAYDELKEKAWISLDLVSGDGFLKSVFKLLILHMLAFFTKGKVLLAGIDGYPFALASRLFPFSSVETFDDGLANVLSWSKYYSERPISGRGLRRFILRIIFPMGGAYYLRSRSEKHYTIFPDQNNILVPEKVVPLNWDWARLLIPSDLKLIDKEISRVVLGTPIHDHRSPEDIKVKALDALKNCDLYIMHPRERDWFQDQRAVKPSSPAESILVEISKRTNLVVYHFSSTVAFSLRGYKNITFVDLLGFEDA